MASIKDVAKYAGVAPSTVSLVLNNAGYVSQRTREKVESAVRELNYTPNELARNLYRNRTNMIGIIVPDTAHPFFLRLYDMQKFIYIDLATRLWSVLRFTEKTVRRSILIC